MLFRIQLLVVQESASQSQAMGLKLSQPRHIQSWVFNKQFKKTLAWFLKHVSQALWFKEDNLKNVQGMQPGQNFRVEAVLGTNY